MRWSFEWIEVSLADLDTLLAKGESPLDGPRIRQELDRWMAEDRADVARTAMVTARSGNRARVESGEWVRFADAFTVPEASTDGVLRARPVPDSTVSRLVGVSVELDPTLSAARDRAEAALSAEIVSALGRRSFGKDIAEIEMPEFHSMKAVTSLSLRSGETRLVGTFTPPTSTDRRLMLFVTAEFGSADTTESAGTEDFAVHYEFIETDLTTLNTWIVEEGLSTAGPALRARFAESVRRGESRLLDSVVAAGRPGHVRLDSVRQVLYPTEYDEPEVDREVPAMPAAFEEWPVGLMCDFTAEWLPNGLLRINPRETKRRERLAEAHSIRLSREIGVQRWMRGEAEVTFPLFYEMEIRQRVDLAPGVPTMLGTLRPERSGGGESAIIAVFARAERIGVISSAKSPSASGAGTEPRP